MPWSPRGEVENRHCAREWRGYGATMLSILELPTVRQRVARISVEAYHVMSAQGWLDERTELLRGAIVEKMTKNMYKSKDYILPSGNILQIQGYENYALDYLLQTETICQDDIITGCKNVPTIWYIDHDGKKRRHFVDIFIPNQNRCIEVKSTWTAHINKHTIFLKQLAAKELGYKYEIWVYNEKGQIVDKHF